MSISYKDAGVDIQAGDETINRIKPLIKATHNKNVLSDIGLFGGFYDAKFPEYEHPVLVASTDGVGTKLKVAFQANKHNTIGQDLVNHCVDDILSCGAKPLFFLDYFATGKLNPEIAEQVIGGFAKACLENECALIGGETAEMPSIYNEGEYDVSGTIVGVVDKENIVNGKKIQTGDVLIALPSSGLHTNGYSLARAVLFKDYNVDSYFEELGTTLGETLLATHKSYLSIVHPLVLERKLTGISHITGGGIVGNTKRILPEKNTLDIDWDSWQRPEIYKLIKKLGNIEEDEMRHVFNLGLGMILVTNEQNVDFVLNQCKNEKPIVIGRIGNK
jgi:phosphoribosylformylglycinamidine cyclo-ligase